MERGRPARNASRGLAYRRLFHRRARELVAVNAHCARRLIFLLATQLRPTTIDRRYSGLTCRDSDHFWRITMI
jgi:hypothetical protein